MSLTIADIKERIEGLHNALKHHRGIKVKHQLFPTLLGSGLLNNKPVNLRNFCKNVSQYLHRKYKGNPFQPDTDITLVPMDTPNNKGVKAYKIYIGLKFTGIHVPNYYTYTE
jgi:hypothetical protein